MNISRAIANYRFVCADLAEGYDYHIAKSAYDACMRAIGAHQRASDYNRPITAREFAEDFYTAYKTKQKEAKHENPDE